MNGHPCSKAGDAASKAAWLGSIPRGLAIIIVLQWALPNPECAALHDPHARTYPPWFTYETAAATSQTGPHIEVLGRLEAGASLSVAGWKLPGGAPCLLVLGTARDDLAVGTGRLVPHPEKVVKLLAQSNGCLSVDLPLGTNIPKAGKIHVQLVTRVGGKVTLTNAVTVDFGKAAP